MIQGSANGSSVRFHKWSHTKTPSHPAASAVAATSATTAGSASSPANDNDTPQRTTVTVSSARAVPWCTAIEMTKLTCGGTLDRALRQSRKERVMTSRLNPYISFPDNAREALEFYSRRLRRRTGDDDVRGDGHARRPGGGQDHAGMLETKSGFTLMAADTPPGMAVTTRGEHLRQPQW